VPQKKLVVPRSKTTPLPSFGHLRSRALAALVLGALVAGGPASRAEPAPAGGLGLVEAIRLTLSRDPNIAIEQERVHSSLGALEIAASPFDPVVSSGDTRTSTQLPISDSAGQLTTLLDDTLGVTKTFRNGTSIGPMIELIRTGTPGGPVVDTATVSFRIRQPLLRGRGRGIADAGERSARHELTASELDLRFTTAQRVQTVAMLYWQARAAQLNLEVLISSEASAREILDNTRRLVAADETPAGELVQLEANLAAQESAHIDGERALFAARQSLGREIGLDYAEIAALPLPADPLPVLQPDTLPPPAEADRLVTLALGHRADLRASRERQEEFDILVRAAENGLKPQLDLVLTPSYTGFKEGGSAGTLFSPLASNIPGASSLLSLNLSLPAGNNLARGQLVQARAVQSQNSLTTDLVVKGIGAGVPTALDAVRRYAQQLQKASSAVLLFEKTVVNEEKKLRAGTSTLINLTTQRDRLTSARQVEVSAQLSLALSLLDLRFQTGTLLPDAGGGAISLQQSRLTTLPSQEETPP
jgi:outer membrane protein